MKLRYDHLAIMNQIRGLHSKEAPSIDSLSFIPPILEALFTNEFPFVLQIPLISTIPFLSG